MPILALTRRGDLKRKLEAFDQGVDDVLTVPFSPEELLARVVVITRRTYGPGSGDLSMLPVRRDPVRHRQSPGHRRWAALHLTALDQSLLYLLAANAGRVVSRDEILDAVWGPDFIAESNIVDRHIRSLRAKLQNDFRQPRYIATVPGRGYRFIATAQATATGWPGPPETEAARRGVPSRES